MDVTDATSTIEVSNPATGEVVARLEADTPADVEAAARLARAAQERWAAAPWRARRRVLERFHDLALARADEVLDTIQSETGKARRDALAELYSVAGTARHYITHGEGYLRERSARGALPLATSARTGYRPRGLVGIISPWNFPFLLGIADALPALLAGNAVLAKPSERTPRSCLLARELLVEAGLDPALLAVHVGHGSELGPAVVDAVDYVAFTGGQQVARAVATRAADRLVPFGLELGGKNPMLVLPGANVAGAARNLVVGSFANAGQTCIGIERVYVHESLHDELVERLVADASRVQVGWSAGWDTDMGSLSSEDHADAVQAQVDEAIEHGARALVGGRRLRELGPAFYAPTVLADVPRGVRLHDEETFGPVIRVERVADEDEAVRLANEGTLGLNASVWAGSRRHAQAVARRLVAGTACCNATLLAYDSYGVPLGGMRRSGIGRRHGAEGIRRYCEPQSIVAGYGRGGGYDSLLELVAGERRARLLLAVTRARRHVPGIR